MIALNSKTISSGDLHRADFEDTGPCWYAEIERADKKKEYKWKVGSKHNGKKEEYSFKISKIGDVNDNNFWAWATGLDFSIKLIDAFRTGGQKAVKSWISAGCPC